MLTPCSSHRRPHRSSQRFGTTVLACRRANLVPPASMLGSPQYLPATPGEAEHARARATERAEGEQRKGEVGGAAAAVDQGRWRVKGSGMPSATSCSAHSGRAFLYASAPNGSMGSRALFEKLARDDSSNLAMVPWAPFQSQSASTALATATEMMDVDAEDNEGMSMEVEQDRCDQLATADAPQGEVLHQWLQHCMIQQSLKAAS